MSALESELHVESPPVKGGSAAGSRRGGLVGVGLVLASLGAWEVLSLVRVADRALVAGPWETALALAADPGGLGVDLAATFLRAGLGLLIGTVFGALVGVAIGALSRVTRLGAWLLDVARSVPPVVWLPLCLLALGYGDEARVATVSLGVAAVVAVSIAAAIGAPRSPRQEVLLVAGASWSQRLAWTQPWESFPALAVGARVAASMAVVVATVSEMVAGAPRGLGSRLVTAQVMHDAPQLTACIVVVGFAGFALSRLLERLERTARRFAGAEVTR